MTKLLHESFKFVTNFIFQQVPVESRKSFIKGGKVFQWRKDKHLFGLLLQMNLENILTIELIICEHVCKSCISLSQYIAK